MFPLPPNTNIRFIELSLQLLLVAIKSLDQRIRLFAEQSDTRIFSLAARLMRTLLHAVPLSVEANDMARHVLSTWSHLSQHRTHADFRRRGLPSHADEATMATPEFTRGKKRVRNPLQTYFNNRLVLQFAQRLSHSSVSPVSFRKLINN